MAERSDPVPEEETRIEEAAQPWAHLVPTDVLRSVALRLRLSDLSNFRKVCRLWRSLSMESSYPLGRSPLFLFSRSYLINKAQDFGDHEKLYLYSPLHNVVFSWAASREVLGIYNTMLSVYSKDGWFVCLGHEAIIFFNPCLSSTTAPAVIMWTAPVDYGDKMLVSMSAPPTDPDCILLIMQISYYRIKIITGREGGMIWRSDVFDFRSMCLTSPVFHGGRFFCLMLTGALGIYDPRRRTWDVHCLGAQCLGIKVNEHNVLVESNGELLNVFQCDNRVDPIVYKLNESNESSVEWKEVRDLGGRALFLDEKFALSAVAEDNGMEDQIFYSKFGDTTHMKVDYELHQSAGGDLRLVPRPQELVRMSLREERIQNYCYNSKGPKGSWFQPNWDNNVSIPPVSLYLMRQNFYLLGF